MANTPILLIAVVENVGFWRRSYIGRLFGGMREHFSNGKGKENIAPFLVPITHRFCGDTDTSTHSRPLSGVLTDLDSFEFFCYNPSTDSFTYDEKFVVGFTREDFGETMVEGELLMCASVYRC